MTAAGRLAADFTRGFTPAVDAFTIRAVAALAAAFLEAARFAALSEDTTLIVLFEAFVLADVFDLATLALALTVLEFFCANAQSACAAPASNTAPSNHLDIQFTAPISAKTSH
ncbi:MAG: hypothetical protein Q4B17_01850 [Lautropia sp.]|nr:hypothetical protein [Lautropia sp.]